MRTKQWLISVGATVSLIFVGVLLTPWMAADVLAPTDKETELTSALTNSKLFIRTRNWGVTDDHQLTILSAKKESNFDGDSIKEFLFKGLEPFLYQQRGDSLILYTRKQVAIPAKWSSKWMVIQIEVDNPQMMNMWRMPDYKHI